MGMIGTRSNKLDAKGRVAVPAKWRTQLGDDIIVTPGAEKCLNVYGREEFEKMLEKLSRTNFMSDEDARRLSRKILGDSEDMLLDKQGRILLTNEHRKYADLFDEQDVIFKGVGDHLEIWKPENWETYDEGIDIAKAGRALADKG